MPDPSTDMGGDGRAFPATHWSVIRDAKDIGSPTSRTSLEELATTYWRPVYAYFRRRWNKSNEESKDMTQEFFLSLTNKDFLQNPSPEHGRFRSYVMAALDNFARMDHRKKRAQKRGGDVRHFSLDIKEGFEPASEGSPEEVFLREYKGSLLDSALQLMEIDYYRRGQETVFRMFMLREVETPVDEDVSYEALARKFDFSVTDVRNNLHRARKKLRDLVKLRIRDTVCSEQEAESEMKELFGESDE